jgi:elongation factor P
MGAKDATEIRVGNVLKIGDALCKVIGQEMRGTGKSGKTVQLKLKSLTDGRFMEKSFRAEDRAEEVEVQHAKLQYLYRDGDQLFFMNQQNYEQHQLSVKAIGKQEILLKENMEVEALCVDDQPLTLEFPKTVEFKVTSAAPGVKGGGDSTYKEVRLENGLTILGPQFLKEGDFVRLNTDDFSYLERVPTKSMHSGAQVPPPKEKE